MVHCVPVRTPNKAASRGLGIVQTDAHPNLVHPRSLCGSFFFLLSFLSSIITRTLHDIIANTLRSEYWLVKRASILPCIGFINKLGFAPSSSRRALAQLSHGSVQGDPHHHPLGDRCRLLLHRNHHRLCRRFACSRCRFVPHAQRCYVPRRRALGRKALHQVVRPPLQLRLAACRNPWCPRQRCLPTRSLLQHLHGGHPAFRQRHRGHQPQAGCHRRLPWSG